MFNLRSFGAESVTEFQEWALDETVTECGHDDGKG